MPATTEDVPEAVAMSVVQDAASLPTMNGDVSGSIAEEITEVTCRDCKTLTKTARACAGCWQVWYCSRAHQVKDWPKHLKDCKPYKLAKSSELGRYLLAARDIKAGELILEDAAMMLGPKTITEPVCLACYRPVNGDYTCRRCGFPMCDKDCANAESHEPECKAVQDSGQKVKVSLFGDTNCMYECITPVRILALKDTDIATWRKIYNLESNSEKREETQIKAITQKTVVDIIKARLRLQYDPEEIHKILGIIDTNAFEVRLSDSSIMGVYGTASLLEHSCIPNTHRTFDADLHLVVRAAVNVKRGEHFTSCYTESLSTTASRVDHLLTSKFFTCSCARCLDPTELGTFISAFLCPTCAKNTPAKASAGKGPAAKAPAAKGPAGKGAAAKETKASPGIVVAKDPTSPSSPWMCMTCESPLELDFIERMVSVVTEESDELENIAPNIKACEAFIEKWSTTFHPNHAILINVKYVLLNLYGSESGASLEEMTPLMLLRKESIARQLLKLADVVVPGISRLRGSVLYELYQSLFYKTCSMFQSGVIPNALAKKIAQEAYNCLLECARVLSYEPPVQPEGQLGLEAKEELRNMMKWMKEEGWKG